MKKYSILFTLTFTLCCAFSACTNESKEKEHTAESQLVTIELPVIFFKEEKHDFGTITQGEKVSYSFHFKNTGETDLIISSANGSCGCTVGTFPHEPIKAGQESKIDVVFDSGGKSGLVEKTVTLTTNCIPNTKVLTINSNIIVPPEK